MKSNGLKSDLVFTIFALSPTGEGISGGDRIFIELSREWSKTHPVSIFTTQEGVEMCQRQHLTGNKLTINKVEKGTLPSNFLLKYIYKIFLGTRLGFMQSAISHKPLAFLYSSSDFMMDVIPAMTLKIRYPRLKWIASWYQTAPNPFRGYEEMKKLKTEETKKERNNKYHISALLYWTSQRIVKPLIKKYADYVVVNNEDEKKQFPEMNQKGKVFVMLGAVRLDEIKKYLSVHHSLSTIHHPLVFDAVFQGRFHPQKGVVEMIDIWKKVVDRIPNAKLAVIGDGPLMKNVQFQISNYKLEKNVKLFGYVFDGEKKYDIFSQSKLVVHPAFYDSGGMASAEAMVFGIPCVGFDLQSYKSYYPKGMLKVKVGDTKAFSDAIIKLLKSDNLRNGLGKDAKKMIEENWSWEIRAEQFFNFIK